MSRYFRKLIQTEGGKFPLINPYTNQIIHELPFQSLEDRISTLHLCSQKMDSFKSLSKSERIAMLENVLKTLQNEK
jgi:acyl-CoA reductase-like NAD-dependent aldehyde dehydrogenase